MRLTDYNEDDPPRATHMDESNRFMGIAVGRTLTAVIVMTLVGYNVMDGVVGLVDEHWAIQVLGAYLSLRVVWPLLCGLEHLVVDFRQSWPPWRRSSV